MPSVSSPQAPVEALVVRGGKSFVAVVDEQSRVHFQPVAVAGNDGRTVTFASGVRAGDRLALSVGDAMVEGAGVRVAEAPRIGAAREEPGGQAMSRLSRSIAVVGLSTSLIAPALVTAQSSSVSRFTPEHLAGIQQGEAIIAHLKTRASDVTAWLAEDTLRLDLGRAAEIAMQNATQIQLSSDTLRLSGISVLESYGRFLPSLTTTVAGFNDAGTALLSSTALVPANAHYYGLGYTLSAGVNLFNGFRDRDHLQATVRSRTAAFSAFGRALQQV